MGLYIKNMEMPNRDHLVLVEIDSNGDVFAAYDGGKTKLTQYKASLVPEPHGRVIDADMLQISTAVPLNGKSFRYVHINNINNAPTIIPASKED